MIDTGGAGPTLLAIQIGGPGAAAAIADSEEWRLQFDKAVAALYRLLSASAGCVQARVEFHQLEGLFADPDSAYAAARRILAVCANPIDHTVPAPVRLLLAGRHAVTAGGDGVRIGEAEARMMHRLPVDRIFATQSVAACLSDALRARFSLFEQDALELTQMDAPAPTVFGDEPTTLFAIPLSRQQPARGDHTLSLRWRGHAVTLHPGSPALTFGRGTDSTVQIESTLVSRHHARLDFRHTNFMLADQSTNGTFVRIENDEEVFLHHEQIVLRGSGVISLGRRTGSGGGKLIYFSVTAQATSVD